MLTWVHFGDLHASDEDGWRSLSTLEALVGEANAIAGAIDFVFLPGDNANHGEPEQYRRIGKVLAGLKPRLFVVPGDHDFEPKTLEPFYRGLGVEHLPRSVLVNGHRCLLLDLVSAGSGGPDFRLGDPQTQWLRKELDEAARDRGRPAVFMHAFPGDLHAGGEALAKLFAQARVATVDTGHTHYNELLNDGGAIYTATRSTGQIEEGPPGFSFHVIDGAAVSFRFKPLASSWPFVLITSPADRRLIAQPAAETRHREPFAVRAKVFGEPIERVELVIDDGPARPMAPVTGERAVWSAEVRGLDRGLHRLRVTAHGAFGYRDEDAIEIDLSEHAPSELKPRPGDHVHSVGAWPEKGLLGTQLGPNKNGKIKW